MSNNLKIEVLVEDIPESGAVVSQFPTQEYVDQQLNKKAGLTSEGRLNPSQSPDYTEIPGLYEHIEDTKEEITTSISDALNNAKGYTNQQLSANLQNKADLVNGKIPFDQIPFSSNIEEQIVINVENITAVVDQKVAQVAEQVNGVATAANAYTDEKFAENKDYIDSVLSNVMEDVVEVGVSKSLTIPTYLTPEAGVAEGTGVAAGAYYNVRLGDDEAVAIEYQNVSGSPVATGKSYLSALGAQQQEKLASTIKDASGKDQQEINDNLAKQVKIVTPYVFGAKGDRITDDTQALRDFWEYCAKNPVITADCSGDFLISGDIYADTGVQLWWKDKPNYAQNFTGHMTLRPNGYVSGNAVLHLKGFYSTDFMCKFSIICPGTSNYSTRKNATGIIFEDCSRVEACHLEVWYASGRGVVAKGTTSVTNFASIDCWYCGATAGASAANNIALSNPTYIHTGSSGNTIQRTEITVSENSIPSALQVNDFVMFFNSAAKYSEVKQIREIDRVNNKITVFPWVYTSDEAYSPYYIIGGGFYADGGDTSATRIGRLSSVGCGVSCNSQSLYPVSIFSHTTQFCGIGFASGMAASEGGVTTSMYCEANGLNDLACSGNAKYTYISIGPEAEEWKFAHLQAAILSGDQRIRNNLTSPRIYGKTGQLPLSSNGQLANGVTQFSPTISTGKATPISLFINQSEGGGARGTTVYLDYNDIKNREFGLDAVWVLLHSSTPSGAMSGNAIFAPVSGQSYTVNGSPTWSTPIHGPTLFCCRYINGDWRVFRFNGFVDSQRATSVNYDPPSLVNATQQSTVVVLNGAKLGDTVVVSFDKPLIGTRMWGEVTSANTVTVYHRNDTGTVVDVPSGALTVKLI